MIRLFASYWEKSHGLAENEIVRHFRQRRGVFRGLVYLLAWSLWIASLYLGGYYARYLWLGVFPLSSHSVQNVTEVDYVLSAQQYVFKKRPLPQARYDTGQIADDRLPALADKQADVVEYTDAENDDDATLLPETPGSAHEALRQRVRDALDLTK